MSRYRSPITTHVLDTTRGQPAVGVEVVLEQAREDGGWAEVGRANTDEDGRIEALVPESRTLDAGTYRLTFATADYFEARDTRSFYPHVVVVFTVTTSDEHYHVPLLLSPHGYTTYRGS